MTMFMVCYQHTKGGLTAVDLEAELGELPALVFALNETAWLIKPAFPAQPRPDASFVRDRISERMKDCGDTVPWSRYVAVAAVADIPAFFKALGQDRAEFVNFLNSQWS